MKRLWMRIAQFAANRAGDYTVRESWFKGMTVHPFPADWSRLDDVVAELGLNADCPPDVAR